MSSSEVAESFKVRYNFAGTDKFPIRFDITLPELISSLYEDGYPSKGELAARLREEYDLSPKEYTEELNSFYDNIMTDLYKRPKKVKNFSKFDETIINRTHQIDLMEMPVDSQTGAKYCMNVIDTASRKAAAIGLVDKEPKTVVAAWKEIIISGALRMPARIQSDEGREFKGSFDDYMTEHHIHHISTLAKNHQAIVERFNSSLQKRLFRYMIREETEGEADVYTDWISVLDQCVDAYNNTKHSTTKMKPQQLVLQTKVQLEPREPYEDKNVLLIGTSVRYKLEHKTRVRATDPLWSSEAYIVIAHNKKTDVDPIKYRIADSMLGHIDKLFYREELLPVNDVSTLTGFTPQLALQAR